MPVYASFDFANMEAKIHNFENSRTPNEILASLTDGSHVYFKYLSDLVTLSQMDSSTLKDMVYQSLEPFLTLFIQYWRDFDLNHHTPSRSTGLKWDVPLSQSFMDFPDEIKMHIICAIPFTDLLALRVVNKHLWELITPITHCRLRFRMPPRWAAFTDSSMMPYEWASGAELLGTIFIAQAWFPIISITYSSWPLRNHCFFRFLPNAAVTRVTITGHRHVDYFYPLIPFPFMSPSTVKDLKLARCSLMCHSLLGLISPGTQLESLKLDRVNDGFVITPSSPLAPEIDIWRELNGLHSFRQQLVKNPPPASLRCLKINYAPFIPQGTMHVDLQPTFYQPDYMQDLLIAQLFCVPEAQHLMRPYLQAGEHFPVHLLLSSLVDLDICVGPFVYRHVRWGWAELSKSLTTLTIRDCDVESSKNGDSSMHLPLSGLCMLEHVKLVAPVRSIHCMLWSVISWSAPAKELTMATLNIIVCVDCGDRWFLRSKLTEFGGSVRFSVASSLHRALLKEETDHLSSLCKSLTADTSVKARFRTSRLIIFPEYIVYFYMHKMYPDSRAVVHLPADSLVTHEPVASIECVVGATSSVLLVPHESPYSEHASVSWPYGIRCLMSDGTFVVDTSRVSGDLSQLLSSFTTFQAGAYESTHLHRSVHSNISNTRINLCDISPSFIVRPVSADCYSSDLAGPHQESCTPKIWVQLDA
ncbi:hypothetical protein IW261DRAFT_1568826 [Armillaria novae-zelandiae]|uniref:F-box domain-containing protein n=1 Tax=Armillaria novae-zelandiae TaxID=153914 RepID=A0AA39NZW5_9AGAR|nr:hypothetical protein IW261DRAFT_1568826 [Armillaria novae-zelandiae]